MELITIGTGSCVPSLERGSSSSLVLAGELTVAVDLGLGALHGMLRAGVTHREVDAIALTHQHLDHSAELLPLLFAANYDEEPRSRPLTLIGRTGFKSFLDSLIEVYGHWLEAQDYELELVELEPGEGIKLGEVELKGGEVAHTDSSLGYRFEHGGASLVISGDTGPSPEFESFAAGADLLLCEAALAKGVEAPYHLSASQAGEVARRAGVKRLVLTHFYPSSDLGENFDPAVEARAEFDGEVVLAFDGMRGTTG